MSIKHKASWVAVGVLSSMLAGGAYAQGHGFGGGGHGGGAHFGGGGHAVAHAGGSGAHFGGAAHFAGYGYAHGAGGAAYAVHGGYPTAYHGGGAYHGGAYAGHGAYGYPGGHYFGHGYSTGAYWGGGYWRGGFWPRAYYGGGFAWFLPVLPLAYATYWYSGVPYYYANDVYYTYNPSYEGYVATDLPPVADSGSAGAGLPPTDLGAQSAAAPVAQGSGSGDVFMYPKNGQSAEQQASDKAECQRWASEQAGQVAQNPSDYHRAMVACVEGRGYSAR